MDSLLKTNAFHSLFIWEHCYCLLFMAFDISMKTIFSYSQHCHRFRVQTSNLDDDTTLTSVGENPLVQSISYTKHQGSDTWRYTETYDYEDNNITSRTESDVDLEYTDISVYIR